MSAGAGLSGAPPRPAGAGSRPRAARPSGAAPRFATPPAAVLGWLAIAAIFAAYFARASVVGPWALEQHALPLDSIALGLIIGAALYLAARNVAAIHGPTLFLILAAGASVGGSEDVALSFSRWGAWGLILAAAGSLFAGDHARAVRTGTWSAVRSCLLAATLASLAWHLAGLPSAHPLGRHVTGVMNHSMLLGPVAGLAALVSLANAIVRRSPVWGATFVASLATCMLSGSRLAVGGCAAGIVTITVLAVPWRWLVPVLLVVGSAAWNVEADLEFFATGPASGLAESLHEKGLANTRESLWANRLEEFARSPATGIGFGHAESDVSEGESGIRKVEPGSSYLAILSMTGVVGTAGFAVFAAGLAVRLVRRWRDIGPFDRLETAAVAAFWTVHFVGEGYVLFVGSILCFFFWAWTGRALDLPSRRHGGPCGATAPPPMAASARSVP